MKRPFYFFIFIFCMLSSLISCDKFNTSEDDGLEGNTFTYQKGKYYTWESEDSINDNWDACIFKDDTVIVAKRDTINKQIIYCINLNQTTTDNCLIFSTTEDGELLTCGNQKRIFNVSKDDNSYFLWSFDELSNLQYIYIPRGQKSRTANKANYANNTNKRKSIWSGLKTKDFTDISSAIFPQNAILGVVSNGKDAIELTENLHNGEYQKFAEGVSKTVLIAGISVVNPALGGAIQFGFWTIEHTTERQHEDFRQCFYGTDVYIYISGIRQNTNGTISVNVTVGNINKIPKQLLYNSGDAPWLPNAVVNNYIFIGVLARYMFPPTYNNNEYCSQEAIIDLNGTNEQELTLTLPTMNAGKYMIRPYLRTNIDKIYDKNGRIHDDDVVYGESIEYDFFPAYIKGGELIYAKYNPDEGYINFIYYISAGLTSNKDIEEWGLYEEKDGQRITYKMTSGTAKLTDEIRFDENRYDFDTDCENFVASIDKELGVYIKWKSLPGIDNPDSWQWGEIMPIKISAKFEKPYAKILKITPVETNTFYDLNYPELHHGKKTTFDVELSLSRDPFSSIYGTNGGKIFEQIGGYNPHPYFYNISHIEESVDGEFTDEGNLKLKLHVYHYYVNPDKNTNDIYYGYIAYLNHDAGKIYGDNYIRFIYNNSARAYTEAQIINGKLPDLEYIDYKTEN